MDILAHITKLREDRGWSEYRLAKEAGLPQSTLTNLYKRNNSPTFSTLEAICRAFGITFAQFFSSMDSESKLTESQKELLENWAKLPKIKREKVLSYIQGLLNSN